MVADAYKAELTDFDEQQRVDLAIERLRAQDAVRDLYLSVVPCTINAVYFLCP